MTGKSPAIEVEVVLDERSAGFTALGHALAGEGPAAVLYGRGSSGGLVNRVTKKPGVNVSDVAVSEEISALG